MIVAGTTLVTEVVCSKVMHGSMSMWAMLLAREMSVETMDWAMYLLSMKDCSCLLHRQCNRKFI